MVRRRGYGIAGKSRLRPLSTHFFLCVTGRLSHSPQNTSNYSSDSLCSGCVCVVGVGGHAGIEPTRFNNPSMLGGCDAELKATFHQREEEEKNDSVAVLLKKEPKRNNGAILPVTPHCGLRHLQSFHTHTTTHTRTHRKACARAVVKSARQ